jgi:hypothetical protein
MRGGSDVYHGVTSLAHGESRSSLSISSGVQSAGGFRFQKSDSAAVSRAVKDAQLAATINRSRRLNGIISGSTSYFNPGFRESSKHRRSKMIVCISGSIP